MARNLPPFPALRAFEAAARHESFTAAANELHVTHGAISRQVAAFETWLGVQVFHRNGKRVAVKMLHGARLTARLQGYEAVINLNDYGTSLGRQHLSRRSIITSAMASAADLGASPAGRRPQPTGRAERI